MRRGKSGNLIALSLVLISLLSIQTSSIFNNDLELNLKISQETDGAPIIEWFAELNATNSPGIAYDGAYTGQTEEVWRFTHWVNDSDGVDTVLFRFWRSLEDGWFNTTPLRIQGDEHNGRYQGNLTWAVSWDWANARPIPAGGGFFFKIYANDSLGNWVETGYFECSGGYMIVNPPLHYYLFSSWGLALLGLAFGCVAIAGAVIRQRRFQ
ncbi:MAG: hypothetical protein RTU92_12145 [Candidatus Thorarchaeota archaeon]